MQHNTKAKARPVQSGPIASELQLVLSSYFDCHSFEETEDTIEMLIASYICGNGGTIASVQDIFQMSYVTCDISKFLSDIDALHGIGLCGSINSLIENLFDAYQLESLEETIKTALHSWIAPVHYKEPVDHKLATAIDAFMQINKLIRKLEVIHVELNENGGVSCV